jgi:hypothetical protein
MKLIFVVAQPLEPLVEALVERTCELAASVPHVEAARLVKRNVTPSGHIVLAQHWRARTRLPSLLQPHVEDALQDWRLTLERDPGDRRVRWRAESAAVQVPGRCHGTLEFAPALGGRGTRIELTCEVPTARPALRTIFGAMIERHWRALAAAAAADVATSARAPVR